VFLSQLGTAGATSPPPLDAPIRFLATTFHPTRGEAPDVPPGLTLSGYAAGQRGYYIVQFAGPVRDEWKEAVVSAGGDLLGYIPEFAFKVRMTPEVAAQIGALPGVAWVGIFHPAYKISPRAGSTGPGLYRVVVEHGGDVPASIAALERSGALLLRRDRDTMLVVAQSDRLGAMAHVLDVAWIEPFDFPVTHNDQAGGVVMGGSMAHTRGYNGDTQIVAVADTGIGDGTAAGAHPDIPAGRVVAIYSWTAADIPPCYDIQPDGARDVDSGHGTHTAVSILGDGGAGGLGLGTAPGAGLVFQAVEDYIDVSSNPLCAGLPDGYYLIGLPVDLHSLYQQAYDDGARIHSNSWGSDDAGAYNTDSANTDDFVFNNPTFVVTYSAGNAGIDASPVDGVIDPGSVGSPATAKNVIAVGASEGVRPGGFPCDSALTYLIGGTSCASREGANTIFTWGEAWPDDYPAAPWFSDPSAGNVEQMAAFSSRGPTDDGRIKPDVVAPGTWILSGYSSEYQQGYGTTVNPVNGLYQYDGWGFPLDSAYKHMGGTSMSNPLVAGGAAVVADFYEKAHTHDASAALVKATIINSARDLLDENNDGADDNDFPIPNIHEGWGIVDLDNATDGSHIYVDNTTGLATAASAMFEIDVESNGSPLRITLAWSDYPAAPAAALTLVNDLDLVVTAPNGTTTYVGNHFSGGWSQASTSYDRTNNLENVYIQTPTVGTWTVTVSGYNVPSGPQPFALVIDGDLAPGTIDNTPPTFSGVPGPVTQEATGPSGAIVTFTPPTATDDIDGPVPVECTPASGSTFALGTTTVSCEASDTSGNTATANFDVTVQDTTNPTLGAMPVVSPVEATGPSGAIVNFTLPTATDTVDTSVDVDCVPASGSIFALGTTTVMCTATDDSANTDSDTFGVTVQDTTNPVLGVMPVVSPVEATGPSGAVVNYSLPSATDLVDTSVEVGCAPTSGSTFPIGTTTVTCTATDDSSNTDTDSFGVTVQDTTAPVLSNVPTNQTVEATGVTGVTVSYVTPTATDLVDGTVAVVCTPSSGSTFALGTTTVSCEASDTSGNTATDTFDVTVQDTTNPVLGAMPVVSPMEATGPSGAIVNYTLPTATDTVDTSVGVECVPASGSTFALGTTTVTCTATDDSGNTDTDSFTATVEDTTDPVISNVPEDITTTATGPGGATVTYTGPTATDVVDPSVPVICSPTSGSTFQVGTTTVTCTATDDSGNTATDTFTVTVAPEGTDTTLPVIDNVPTDITEEATGPGGAVVTYANPTATDDVDGLVPVGCDPSSGSTFPLSTTTVTCTAEDAAGNTASATFDVTVEDTTPPVISNVPDDITEEATGPGGAIVTYPSPTATDLVDGSVDVVCSPVSGLTFPVGTTTVTCMASDSATNEALLERPFAEASGNTAIATFDVTVVDAPGVIRYAGSDRYATAAAAATGDFPSPPDVDVVFVAYGGNFPDALAGSAIAGRLGAPLLLVHSDGIPDATRDQLTRLTPDEIVILGGTGVISMEVEDALHAYAQTVVRLAGPNRYATAVAISQYGFPDDGSADTVIVATGRGFADALASGPAAVALDGPVLLTDSDDVPDVVAAEIARLGPSRVIVVGGSAVISDGVVAELEALVAAVDRVSGPNRYETAVDLSVEAFPLGAHRVYLTTGLGFPDGLAGGSGAAWWDAPILLVPGDDIPDAVADEIGRLGAEKGIVLGGEGVVAIAVEVTLAGII
jgi:putative cell wall-binding protein